MMKRKIMKALGTIISASITAYENTVDGNTNVQMANDKDVEEKDNKTVEPIEIKFSDAIFSLARWGNLALGLSYQIPQGDSADNVLQIDKAFSYLHGQILSYRGNFKIYIEKSLDNHTDLNTLAVDVFKEKASEKYEKCYKIDPPIEVFSIAKNINETIGDFETVYFESNIADKNQIYKGYSFQYNDEYICVYAKMDARHIKELDKPVINFLKYIINSMEVYNGESFYELDNNFNLTSIYSGGDVGIDKNGKEIFTINSHSAHPSNGNFKRDDILINKLDTSIANWDNQLDSIFKVADDLKTIYKTFIWSDKDKDRFTKVDFVDEVTINNIPMKRYCGKYYSDASNDYEVPKYYEVYTFILNEEAYIVQYATSSESYKGEGYAHNDLLFEQMDSHSDTTILNADTSIRTIRLLKDGEKSQTFVNKG